VAETDSETGELTRYLTPYVQLTHHLQTRGHGQWSAHSLGGRVCHGSWELPCPATAAGLEGHHFGAPQASLEELHRRIQERQG
jgi:hypothetical protein